MLKRATEISRVATKRVMNLKQVVQPIKKNIIDTTLEFQKKILQNSDEMYFAGRKLTNSIGHQSLAMGKKVLWYTPLYTLKLGGSVTRGAFKVATRTRVGRYLLSLGALGFTLRASYVYGTSFHREIEVKKTFWRYGENEADSVNEYMLADAKGNIYGVRNSTWFGQFYSTEMWAGMIEGKKYDVIGYGVRIAFLGIYPHVVQAHAVDKNHKKRLPYWGPGGKWTKEIEISNPFVERN